MNKQYLLRKRNDAMREIKHLNKYTKEQYENYLRVKEETGFGSTKLSKILGISRATLESWRMGCVPLSAKVNKDWLIKNLKNLGKYAIKRIKDEKTCERCGKIFYVGSDIGTKEYERRKYCSKTCQSKSKKHSEETKKKISNSRIGEKNPQWTGGKLKGICIVCGKEFHYWQSNKSGKFCSQRCGGLFNIKTKKFTVRPTNPEKRFMEICKKHKLPFKYVGDGKFWIENINPDFVESNGKKICVEIFGEYWHSPLYNRKLKLDRTFKYRIKILKKYGWKCIIFWESEMITSNAEEFVLTKLEALNK